MCLHCNGKHLTESFVHWQNIGGTNFPGNPATNKFYLCHDMIKNYESTGRQPNLVLQPHFSSERNQQVVKYKFQYSK